MRVALVANPKSGSGRSDPGAIASALRQRGAEVVPVALGDPLPQDVDRVVAAGGDGTIAPIAARARVPLAVIATGTANDFARALELPRDLDAALDLAADPDARTRRIDVGDFEGRPFVNAAAAGLSVVAAERAHGMKSRLGPLAYVVGAAHAALTAGARDLHVTCDGELVHDGPAWQVVVAQTGAFGGGSSVGAAEASDGRLDVVVLPAGSRASLLIRGIGLRSGQIAAQDGVPHAVGRRIEVRGAWQFNVDGELTTDAEPAIFEVRGQVDVVVGT